MGVNIILSSISVVLVTVTGKAHDVPRSHRLIDCRPPPLTPSPLCSYRRRSVGRSACMPQASAVVCSPVYQTAADLHYGNRIYATTLLPRDVGGRGIITGRNRT